MSALPMPSSTPAQRRRHRRSFNSIISVSDDERDSDAITPAPKVVHIDSKEQHPVKGGQEERLESSTTSPSPASSRRSSFHSDHRHRQLGGEGVDSEQLWRRMLAVQRIFGCYNSARMSAALSAGDEEQVGRLRPSKACLDLLNESVEQLPEEAKEQVEKYLYGSKRKSGSWRRRFLPAPQ